MTEVPGAFNLRDLGGIEISGGVIAVGRVYRCDLLHRIDVDAAAQWLAERNVVTLIDLRTAQERIDDGHMPPSDSLDTLHLPLLDEVWSWEDEHAATDEWFLRDRTIEMYERHGDRIVAALTTIAESSAGSPESAALFHCTAGKDRTGVVASALLGVLGADREAIVTDYANSTHAMEAIIAWYRAENAGAEPTPEPDPERIERLMRRAASPTTMAGVIDHLDAHHGGFAGWAETAGLSPETLERLRQHCLGTAAPE